MIKYLGMDGVERGYKTHIRYLEGCAQRWEDAKAPEEAARVRERITSLKAVHEEERSRELDDGEL